METRETIKDFENCEKDLWDESVKVGEAALNLAYANPRGCETNYYYTELGIQILKRRGKSGKNKICDADAKKDTINTQNDETKTQATARGTQQSSQENMYCESENFRKTALKRLQQAEAITRKTSRIAAKNDSNPAKNDSNPTEMSKSAQTSTSEAGVIFSSETQRVCGQTEETSDDTSEKLNAVAQQNVASQQSDSYSTENIVGAQTESKFDDMWEIYEPPAYEYYCEEGERGNLQENETSFEQGTKESAQEQTQGETLQQPKSVTQALYEMRSEMPTSDDFIADPASAAEKLKEIFDAQIQREKDAFVANGGNPDEFVPAMIPSGLVYNLHMSRLRNEEKMRIKEQKKLKNRLKRWWAQNVSQDASSKDDKQVAGDSKQGESGAVQSAKSESCNCGSKNAKSSRKEPVTIIVRTNQSSASGGNLSENGNQVGSFANGAVDPQIGDGVKGTQDFENNYCVDDDRASSSNKVYQKKATQWDRKREAREELLLKEAELRKLGLPADDELRHQVILNAEFKAFGVALLAFGFMDISGVNSLLPLLSGGTMIFGAGVAASVNDLKYRMALQEVREAYIRCNGAMTKEDLYKILDKVDKKPLPDKYDLACMLKEDREALLKEYGDDEPINKKALAKHMKYELRTFMRDYQKKKEQERLQRINEALNSK